MPEGDTVHLLARRLGERLIGRTLVRTDFRVPAFATSDLSGQVVEDVGARGKHLLIRTDAGLTIHSHLKMEGRWHLQPPRGRWPAPPYRVRLVLETEDVAAFGVLLGVLEIIRTSEEAVTLAHLGPDVLGPDWDPGEALRRLLGDPERTVGEAVIDQRVMAGPGNIYRNESLFLRGLHPSNPVSSVRDPAALVDLIKRLMEANRDTAAQVTTGDPRPGRQRWVHGRNRRACRRCGTTIRSGELGPRTQERVVYWCPSCQPRI